MDDGRVVDVQKIHLSYMVFVREACGCCEHGGVRHNDFIDRIL